MKLLDIFAFVPLILGLVHAVELVVFQDDSVQAYSAYLWSAVATFQSAPTDGQLVKLVEDAFQSMQDQAADRGTIPQKVPAVMSALAVGKDVYFSSSSRGPPLIYQIAREEEDACGEMWNEVPSELKTVLTSCVKSKSDQHIYNAQCGEINNLFEFYMKTEQSIFNLQTGEARVVSWEVKEGTGQIKNPCWDSSGWSFGCRDVLAIFQGKIKSLTRNQAIQSQDYANIGPVSLQYQPLFPDEWNIQGPAGSRAQKVDVYR